MDFPGKGAEQTRWGGAEEVWQFQLRPAERRMNVAHSPAANLARFAAAGCSFIRILQRLKRHDAMRPRHAVAAAAGRDVP